MASGGRLVGDPARISWAVLTPNLDFVRRTVLLFALLVVAVACSDEPSGEAGIDVIDVSGPLDASALDFMTDSIEAAADEGQVLAVLQIDSPAVLDGDALRRLEATLEAAPLPVAVWLGPAPAVAYGGAARIVYDAEEKAVSPGSTLGLSWPTVAGREEQPLVTDHVTRAEDSGLPIQPTIRQYLQDLDGATFTTADGPVTVETVVPFEDGVTLKTVTFRQPDVGTRFWRLAATPEAAFFFLVVGLTIASFEFFAIGPGVAAGVAALSLLLAGWGIVNLPVKPWALGLAILGWMLLTAAYQKGGILVLTLLGAVMLQVAGSFYVDGSGQIDPRWYLVLPSVLAVLFFFLLAMPTVQRARFSTGTIGRDGLIGETGVALDVFDPDGMVEVNGAQWRATAHREAGLVAGSAIRVAGVDGMFLEVEPADRSAKTDS
jgi:membrane-bound serine protease (ClpP class)